VVDFGEEGPIRCGRCKAYINPFMSFNDGGRHFQCNFCSFQNPTPAHYFCPMGADNRRRDAYERAELCKGSVEFVATAEYKVWHSSGVNVLGRGCPAKRSVKTGNMLSLWMSLVIAAASLRGIIHRMVCWPRFLFFIA
jgi:Sec23/Sec24 zinc finger